jgi:hypothetical protein
MGSVQMNESIWRPLAAGVRAVANRRGTLAMIAAAAGAVLGLHTAAAHYFMPFRAVFSGEFLHGGDYDTHIGQTLRVVEGMHVWGKSWVYDVKLIAGQPEGTIFDADNKGWEVWTYLLLRSGVSLTTAFNSFVLLAMLGAPLVVFISARLFGLGAAASVLAAAMASTLWFFDSFCHWAWWIGMVAYAFASYFALLPFALFHRFIDHGSWRAGAACALINGIAHLVHPYSFFMLVVPMLALYLRARRRLSARAHAGVALIGIVTVGMNLYWLLPAIAHWHYILDSAFYGATGPRHLVADFFNILFDTDDSGVIGTRAGFRFLYLSLGIAGVVLLRARRDPRALPFGAALAALFVLGYLGEYVPGALQIQPYRHVLPLGFFATLPAAAFCELLSRERPFAGLARPARGLLVIAGLFAVQHFVGEALYFTPKLMPEPGKAIHGEPSALSAYGFFAITTERKHLHYGIPPDDWVDSHVEEVIEWVSANVPPGSRVLAETMSLGERIAWKTNAEVMGGFRERNIQHALGNLFRIHGYKPVAEAELEAYLRTYGIGWIITFTKRDDFENSELLEKLPSIKLWNIYRTRFAVDPFLKGHGRLRAKTNSIQVHGTPTDQDVVLSYHWHESLRCTPGCRVERWPIRYDPVGFIRVRAPHPANFIIYNSYR